MAFTMERRDHPRGKESPRIKVLKEHELVIPQGIKYDLVPNKYRHQLMLFEKKMFPFMVVACRIKPVKPTLQQSRTGGYQPYDEFEAIVVDSKTFHCTVGGLWDLRLKQLETSEQWAAGAIVELLEAYHRYYKLDHVIAKPDQGRHSGFNIR